ncbi:MAG: hypothetical protein JW787_11010 [Sedimentisphaerales bacterium]|nr:hypothetical protein [Sedimentisphaerales bacterium]
MTEEMKIEELLNSYVDGELPVRQRTEVKRMAANDPKIAGRLKQLQKCRTLVSALPVTQAPSFIIENVKAALQTKKNSITKTPVSISDYGTKKTGLFLFRRVFAAAAMLTLAAVLVIVINMLTPSDTGGPNNGDSPIAAIRFSGKLELKTNDIPGVHSVISEAIKNSGYAASATPLRELNRRVYTLNCSGEGLNKILTELEDNWDKLYAAELFVDTKIFGENVQIDGITPSQISAIVNQKDAEQSIQTAKNISVINSLNELLNDRGITSFGSGVGSDLLRIPQPVIVRPYPPAQRENDEKTVQLRIILSR